jgi:hypothetical protein
MKVNKPMKKSIAVLFLLFAVKLIHAQPEKFKTI